MEKKIFNRTNPIWNESPDYNQMQFMTIQRYYDDMLKANGYVHTIMILSSLYLMDKTDVDAKIAYDENSKEGVFDWVPLGNNEFEIIFPSLKEES